MLEIRNVTKIYRSKTGEQVKALDNVSVSFPESGMVFILGKSGSGKSTLLNVIGGLDSYDNGEFVIMGKSSKSFGGSDFDAYRNTFIGFIFQEYNVLDEFSVGANIGLALELQGKKATNKKINEILNQVDLANYASRKPNELSGGQKQRVAIARALVKEPQIIMADEPTGALDSNTGKQIFDTLKELSKHKLVLVVSHDRDFAERYADRIIELSDGHIISDVTKHDRHSSRLSDGIHKVTDSILRIEKGYKLTENDLKMINDYLTQVNNDIILSGDSRVNEELRSAAGITEQGGTTVFESTNAEKDYSLKQYDGKKTEFIHSRLPMKNALKMGSSGLKHKKFRLVLTIILSMLAFAMFGLADTMAVYEKISAATSSIIDSNIKTASVNMGVRHDYYNDGKLTSSYHQIEAMNDEDIEYLREQTGLKFVPVFTGSQYAGQGGFSVANQYASFQQNDVYNGKITGFVNMDAETAKEAGITVVAGRLPEAKGEIVITELMLRSFNEYGFKNSNKNETIAAGSVNANDLIGKHITVSSSYGMPITHTYEIVGVVDTSFDYERFSDYLPSDTQAPSDNDGSMSDMVLRAELENELAYGFHALAFLHGDDISTLAKESAYSMKEIGEYMFGWNSDVYMEYKPEGSGDEDDKEAMKFGMTFNRIARSSDLSSLNIQWINGEKTTLGANEVVVHKQFLNNLIPSSVEVPFDRQAFEDEINRLYPNAVKNDEKDQDLFNKLVNAAQSHHNITEYYLAERRATADILPYILKEFYGISSYSLTSLPDDDTVYDGLSNLVRSVTHSVSEENTIRLDYNSCIEELYGFFSAIDFANSDLDTDSDFINGYLESRGVSDKDWNNFDEFTKRNELFSYYKYEYSRNLSEKQNYMTYTYSEMQTIAQNAILTASGTSMEELLKNIKISHVSRDYELQTTSVIKDYTVSIVGLIDDEQGMTNNLIVSDTMYNDYIKWNEEQMQKEQGDHSFREEAVPHKAGIWAFAVAPMGTDHSTIQKLVEMSYDDDGDFKFSLRNSVMNTLEVFNEFIEIGAQVFLYVGLGFAVFSALLLMNFIAVSISYKKREIGILRAVGARSSDVFKIFFSESLIIALINFVLAIATVITSTSLLNNWMRTEGINITLLSFGIRQVILMLAVSVVVAILASFLPVYNIAKRKPIDAIKDR